MIKDLTRTTTISAIQQQQLPVIVLLKEGLSDTKGKGTRRNNIITAKVIAEMLKTSVDSRGMDKCS